MNSGRGSREEDTILRHYVTKHNPGGTWKEIANKAGLQRCGRSCRSRWLNYLRPGLKHGNFTEEDDRIISSTLYNTQGGCWSLIAAELPGRTDLAAKNDWNSKLRKSASKKMPLPITKCTSTATHTDQIPCDIKRLNSSPVSASTSCTKVPPSDESFTSTKDMQVALGPTFPSIDADQTIQQPPDFDELVNWFIMSPKNDFKIDCSLDSYLDMVDDSSSIL